MAQDPDIQMAQDPDDFADLDDFVIAKYDGGEYIPRQFDEEPYHST